MHQKMVAAMAVFCLTIATAAAAFAQERVMPERGSTTATGWWFYWDVPPEKLVAGMDENASRIVDLEVTGTSPLTLSATTVANSDAYATAWWWYYDQTADQMKDALEQNKARLTDLDVYQVNGELRFASVMVANDGPDAIAWWWFVDQPQAGVAALLDQNNARLTELEGYVFNGQTLYAGAMVLNEGEKATGWWWYLGQSVDQIGKLTEANKARILRLSRSASGDAFDVIMVANEGPEAVGWWWWTETTPERLMEFAGRYKARMFDIVAPLPGGTYTGVMIDNGMPMSGDCGGEMAGVDRVVTTWLKKHGIAGASVAIVKGDRLVYACGYGYADIAKAEPVLPSHRFRLASISKVITDAAVRRLAADGALQLSDTMLDSLTAQEPPGPYADDRLKDVTINHLLTHMAGWDTNLLNFDPMNHSDEVLKALGADNRPSTCLQNATYMFQKHKLDHAPGAMNAYSNFGFCVLELIIEDVTGQPYETYVQQTILNPMGIMSMQVGRGELANRLPNEVLYYDAPTAGLVQSIYPSKASVPAPYGALHVEEGGAGGGWISTAPDLVRFVRFGAPGLGAFNGGFAGTATTVRRSGDVVVAILINSSFPEGGDWGPLVDEMTKSVSTWPTHNLWPKYGFE